MNKNQITGYKYYNLITISFIVCLISSNIAATKLCKFGSLTLDGGTLIFPLLYILNDIITEVYGFKASRKIIWAGLCCNLSVTAILLAIVYIPPADKWSNHEAYAAIFLLSPKIFIASISSYFVGEFLNSATISMLKIIFKGKFFALRAILSTCLGAFVETTLFVSIAFGSFLPSNQLLAMIYSLTLIKIIYEFIAMPVTIKIVSFLKKAENMDAYEKPSLKAIFQDT